MCRPRASAASRSPTCPAYGTAAVGQFAIALLLEICFHVAHHAQAVRDGRWQNCPDFCFWDYPLIDLAGKTLGVIGLGRIGRQTAQIARAMGMHVLAYARHPHAEDASLVEHVSLDELYARSDVISLHCPLFPETRGMICKESIAKMKDGVILINKRARAADRRAGSRGRAQQRQGLCAGLDVVSSEPIRADNPLLHAKNCLIPRTSAGLLRAAASASWTPRWTTWQVGWTAGRSMLSTPDLRLHTAPGLRAGGSFSPIRISINFRRRICSKELPSTPFYRIMDLLKMGRPFVPDAGRPVFAFWA